MSDSGKEKDFDPELIDPGEPQEVEVVQFTDERVVDESALFAPVIEERQMAVSEDIEGLLDPQTKALEAFAKRFTLALREEDDAVSKLVAEDSELTGRFFVTDTGRGLLMAAIHAPWVEQKVKLDLVPVMVGVSVYSPEMLTEIYELLTMSDEKQLELQASIMTSLIYTYSLSAEEMTGNEYRKIEQTMGRIGLSAGHFLIRFTANDLLDLQQPTEDYVTSVPGRDSFEVFPANDEIDELIKGDKNLGPNTVVLLFSLFNSKQWITSVQAKWCIEMKKLLGDLVDQMDLVVLLLNNFDVLNDVDARFAIDSIPEPEFAQLMSELMEIGRARNYDVELIVDSLEKRLKGYREKVGLYFDGLEESGKEFSAETFLEGGIDLLTVQNYLVTSLVVAAAMELEKTDEESIFSVTDLVNLFVFHRWAREMLMENADYISEDEMPRLGYVARNLFPDRVLKIIMEESLSPVRPQLQELLHRPAFARYGRIYGPEILNDNENQ